MIVWCCVNEKRKLEENADLHDDNRFQVETRHNKRYYEIVEPSEYNRPSAIEERCETLEFSLQHLWYPFNNKSSVVLCVTSFVHLHRKEKKMKFMAKGKNNISLSLRRLINMEKGLFQQNKISKKHDVHFLKVWMNRKIPECLLLIIL